MKMGDEHTVPLSTASIAILKMAKSIFPADDEALVFPGLRRQPLSDMTLSKALRDNGGSGFTVHGFRSAFRDWCAETGMNNDWAESALAHAVPNRVEAAYKRTKFLDQRRGLMQEWAEFCVLPAN
jgi:integrase